MEVDFDLNLNTEHLHFDLEKRHKIDIDTGKNDQLYFDLMLSFDFRSSSTSEIFLDHLPNCTCQNRVVGI